MISSSCCGCSAAASDYFKPSWKQDTWAARWCWWSGQLNYSWYFSQPSRVTSRRSVRVSSIFCYRACLNQLVIVIRSSLIVYDHVRSKTFKTRLIYINYSLDNQNNIRRKSSSGLTSGSGCQYVRACPIRDPRMGQALTYWHRESGKMGSGRVSCSSWPLIDNRRPFCHLLLTAPSIYNLIPNCSDTKLPTSI